MTLDNHIELAYLGVEVAEPEALATVLRDVAGMVTGPLAGTWRNDDRAQRVAITQGPADDATVVGFEVANHAAGQAIVDRLVQLGFAVTVGDADQCRLRQVDGLWCTTAPWGVAVELVHGLSCSDQAFASGLVPGGFKTAGVGFGHVVFMVGDAGAADRFVVDGLGMRQTDWLDLAVAPGVSVIGRFYHGNPRHHSLALISPPGPPPPKRLHHLMLEMNRADDVGAAFDRAYASGLRIVNGLGKHDNDQMFSFYLQTPAGFQLEIGHGAREVGPDWDENRAYDRISLWGHQPVASDIAVPVAT